MTVEFFSALPTELHSHVVGASGLEPLTSRVSYDKPLVFDPIKSL